MYWVDKIYKELDEKYKERLEEYNTSTEEIIKDIFYIAREYIQSDLMPDVLINHLGRFRPKIVRIWHVMHNLVDKINKGKIKDEKLKIKIAELQRLIHSYNFKVLNKHQWKTKHYYFKTVELLEEDNKLVIKLCQDNVNWLNN